MGSISTFWNCARAAAVVALAALFCGYGTTAMAGQAQQQPAGTGLQQTIPPVPSPTATQTGPIMRLTVDEAVRMGLEQNLGLQAQRLSPQIQNYATTEARAAFAPAFFSTIGGRNQTQPPSSFLAGTSSTIKNNAFSTEVGLQQTLFHGGGNYQVAWTGGRSTTTGFTNYNPQLNSQLTAQITQPLLRNFKIDALRQQVLFNQVQQQIADVQLRQSVTSTSRAIRNAYWTLVYAVANNRVQGQSLDLAREQLRNNQTRVKVGTMAPIDIVEAEAEVARNEEAVIVSESDIQRAQDLLRSLIMSPETPSFWSATIEPTEQPVLQPRPVDVDAAVKNALANRTDLLQARKNLEQSDINVRYFNNQRLPDFNVQATYGLIGLGGTQYLFGSGFPPPILGSANYPFRSVLADVFGLTYPAWTLGVSVGYPIGTSQAEAGLARAKLQDQQTRRSIENMEMQAAVGVRDMGRQVNTNLKRVQATQAARELAERRLEAEQKKFNVGMSTTFLVFQAQRELASARTAELRSIIDYNMSLVDFEAIQQIPLGGVNTVSPSTGSSVAQGTQGQIQQ